MWSRQEGAEKALSLGPYLFVCPVVVLHAVDPGESPIFSFQIKLTCQHRNAIVYQMALW